MENIYDQLTRARAINKIARQLNANPNHFENAHLHECLHIASNNPAYLSAIEIRSKISINNN